MPVKPRVIFITSFHGLISRVLESGLLEILGKEPNLSVVVLVLEFKKEYFQKAFKKYPRVSIVGVDRNSLSQTASYFHALTFPLLDTDTMSIIRRSHRGYRHRYQVLLAEALAKTVGHFRLGRGFRK